MEDKFISNDFFTSLVNVILRNNRIVEKYLLNIHILLVFDVTPTYNHIVNLLNIFV